MLVNMNQVLLPAKRGKYAVGLFNAVNLELARGIIAAAEASRSPVIDGNSRGAFSLRPVGGGFLLSYSYGKKSQCAGGNPS